MAINKTIFIRQVEKDEIKELQEIATSTFIETFGNENSKSDMEKYLDENFNPGNLKKIFENPNSQLFFAESNKKIIGYLQVNTGKAQKELLLGNAIEIERLYVLSKFHGKNIGKILLNKALEMAKTNNIDQIWLGVYEKNYRAIRFYQKNGFKKFSQHSFILGNDIQTDILMKIEVNNHPVLK